MKRLLILNLIAFFFAISSLYSFGLDLHSSPDIIASAEIFILSDTPAAAYYQPAKQYSGVSLNHSSPFGFPELNVFAFAAQYMGISLGGFALENNNISDKIIYLGYSQSIRTISIGGNIRYYSQSVERYEQLDVFTGNIGAVWEYKIFRHGFSLSNITNASIKNIAIPSVYKYECMLSPLQSTDFAFSFEKENNFEMRYSFAVKQRIAETLVINSVFISNPSQFSGGVCVTISKLSISYGMRTHEYLDYTQSIGVTYRF